MGCSGLVPIESLTIHLPMPETYTYTFTANERRVIWTAVTSLRRRTMVEEVANDCSAIRAQLAGHLERPARGITRTNDESEPTNG